MLRKLALATALLVGWSAFGQQVLDCNSCIVVAQTQVAVQNPSFETFNPLNNSFAGGQYNGGPIPSWTTTGAAGSWQPTSVSFTSTCNGSTIVWVEGSIAQDTGIPLQPNSTYTLTVCTGLRADTTKDNSSLWVMSLFSGCSTSGPNNSIPVGTFVQQTLTCSTGNTVSGNAAISLSDSGTEAVFDSVSLTVMPIGHSAVLTWQDNANPTGTTYNVYRSSGSPWNPILLANGLTNKAYTDTTIVVGQTYTYKITAVVSGVESDGPFVAVALVVQ